MDENVGNLWSGGRARNDGRSVNRSCGMSCGGGRGGDRVCVWVCGLFGEWVSK